MKNAKQYIYLLLLAVVTAGAISWILVQQRDAAKPETRQHAGLGEMMAEETAKQLAKREKKRVVVISLQSKDPILHAQEESFFAKLKTLCPESEIKELIRVDPEGEKRYGPGLGLSTRRFLRIVEHNVKADVLVSFIGTPDPGSAEMQSYTNKIPRFVASTRDLADAKKMLEKNWLRAAVVPRYDFPAPKEEPKTTLDWFNRYFQVVTTNELATLPTS
jgi:hypothetical protein